MRVSALLGALLYVIFSFPLVYGTDVTDGIILIKIGGSSITDKAQRETLRAEALDWMAKTLASARGMNETCDATSSTQRYILVHGAGSFGHHHAKEYSLSGIAVRNAATENEHDGTGEGKQSNATQRQYAMEGLSKTRLSVQTLNRFVVKILVDRGIPAVGISPCFGGLVYVDDDMAHLAKVVQETVEAGLIPVLHGDACLVQNTSAAVAGILSGDTIMEELGRRLTSLMARAVFVTDVDGVFTSDPRVDPSAELLQSIEVDHETGKILTEVTASGSSHAHDVTGGLETKLEAAVSIARAGTEVIIVRCQTQSAERAMRGEDEFGIGSRVMHTKGSPT